MDCVKDGRVNMFKNKILKYIRKASYIQIKTCWTLDRPIAS